MRACILIAAITASAAAQPIVFTRIADTGTTVPGYTATFQEFQIPSVDGNVVALSGRRALSPTTAGIYLGSGGPLTIVADRTTPAPGGFGNFTGFGFITGQPPSFHASDVAFLAEYGVSIVPTGVYYRASTLPVVRVVDQATIVPNGNGGAFLYFDSPTVEKGRVVFAGSESGDNQKGVYSWQGGVLSIVADRSTTIPGGTGTFTSFGYCALDAGRIAFTGLGAGQQRGIYVATASGTIERRYDRNTVVPGGNGAGFSNLGIGAFDGGAVAFQAQGGGTEGVYSDLGGALFAVADKATPVPGRPGLFQFFGDVSLDHGTIAFTGGFNGADRGVFVWRTGALSKVIAQGDVLDGKVVLDAIVGSQAISGDNVAFWVEFTNGSLGIYMATLPSSCYPDCNSDTLLNLSDFGCFQTKFALGDPYADCNGDGLCNLADFGCFQTKFALGCP